MCGKVAIAYLPKLVKRLEVDISLLIKQRLSEMGLGRGVLGVHFLMNDGLQVIGICEGTVVADLP